MATRAEISADVLALVGSSPSLSTGERHTLIQTRYDELYETWLWSRRKRDMVIRLVAQVQSTEADTVTATLDSSTVTSLATPFLAAHAGRQIQVGSDSQYYFVNSFTNTANVVLGDGEGTAVLWPKETESGVSWRIFKSLYSLPSSADTVLSIAGAFALEELDGGRDALDRMDPERSTTSHHPTHWVYAGEDSIGYRQIEVWPVPSTARILRGEYARKAPTLADGTETGLNRAVMVYAVAADCLNMLFAKTGDVAYQQLAVFYERKFKEVETKLQVVDIERLSPPSTISRGPRGLGADFFVSRQDMSVEG